MANAPFEPRAMRLILNAAAAADAEVRAAVEALRAEGAAIEVRVTWEPGDAERFAAEAAAHGAGVVVAAGGDGTLNEVVNGVLGKRESAACAVGVLPFGTANDFASSAGIAADDPRAALRLAWNGAVTWIDVGQVNERLFVNVASGGYAAEVTTDTPAETKQLLGGFAYFLTGLKSAAGVAARPTRIHAEGFDWEGEILGVTIGNGRQAGGGFRVAPRARVDDGLLDLMIIPNGGWSDLAALVGDLTRLGNDLPLKHVVVHQAAWLEIEAPEGLQVNLDGEPMHAEAFQFTTLARRLPICLPADSPLLRPT